MRESLKRKHSGFSGRAVAMRMGLHYSYLSKLERGDYAPLTEERIRALARELGEDPEVLLALGGKVSERTAQLIRNAPERFSHFLQELEQDQQRGDDSDSYASALRRHKNELEELNRRLRDEIETRRSLEEDIRSEFNRYSTLFTLLPDAAVLADLDSGFILDVNDQALKLWKLPREKLVGAHQSALHPQDGNDERTEKFRLHGTAMLIDPVKTEIVDSQGDRVPVIVSAGRVQFGDSVQVLGIFRDISPLLQAQELLEQSELRWMFALEGAREGVWDWDAATNKVFYSPRWKEMLGYADHEIGEELAEWDSRIHPDDYQTIHKLIDCHLEGESPFYECEHRLRCKDGSYKWILDRGMVVARDDKGRPLRVIGTHFDISERKQAEEQLRSSEAFLNALLMSIQDAVSVLAPDLSVRYANRTMEQWYAAQMPLLGKKCHEIFHQRSGPCEKCPSLRCLDTTDPQQEVINVGSASSPLWLELQAFPILEPASASVAGVVKIARDITLRKREEDKLKELEARYRKLFEDNPTIQLLVDPVEGGIIQANAAACAFYGFSHEEMQCKSVFGINTLPKDKVYKAMQDALAQVRNVFSFKHQLHDGSLRDVEVRVTPLEFSNETLLHSLITDITDRKRFEEQLQQVIAEEQLLLNTIQTQIWYLSDIHTYGLLNRAHAVFLGGSVEDFAYKKLGEFLGPEIAEVCMEGNKEVFATASPITTQEWIPDASGELRLIKIMKSPKLDDQGNVEFVVCSGEDITDFQQALEALRQSEEEYRLLFDNMLDGFALHEIMLDAAGHPVDYRFLAVNKAFERITGLQGPEVTGRTVREVLPNTEEVWIERYGRVALTGEPAEFSHYSMEFDKHFMVQAFSPAVGQFACTFADITESVQAKAIIEESERRFRELFEYAPVGICTVTVDGRYLAVNPAHALMYGYASPEAMMFNVENSRVVFANPADRDVLFEMLADKDVVSGFECEMLRKDGSRFWTNRTVRVVRDDAGAIVFYEAFVENIQDRKKAEQASELARQQMLSVLEQLDAGVYVLSSRSAKILFANSYLSSAIGRELTGANAHDVLLKDPESCIFCMNESFSTIGDSRSGELLFANNRWYFCRGKVMPWTSGELAVFVVATDITERKQVEELKEDMDRIMRHDLKSPLNGIIMLPELLLASPDRPPKEKEMLEAIRDSGRKMQRLVDESLSLYKLETGQYEIMPHDIDLPKTLDAIELELTDICSQKEMHIMRYIGSRLESSTDKVTMIGDATLIPFMLSNLLKNAAEAGPPGTNITLAIVPEEPFRIIIHNQGAVPETVRDRFFEKYATAGKGKGTGLGTYSARLIARAHGGDIFMTTCEEEGTSVIVSIPQQILLEKSKDASQCKNRTSS